MLTFGRLLVCIFCAGYGRRLQTPEMVTDRASSWPCRDSWSEDELLATESSFQSRAHLQRCPNRLSALATLLLLGNAPDAAFRIGLYSLQKRGAAENRRGIVANSQVADDFSLEARANGTDMLIIPQFLPEIEVEHMSEEDAEEKYGMDDWGDQFISTGIAMKNWTVPSDEIAYVLEGESIFTPIGAHAQLKPVKVQAGDLVKIPEGLNCRWDVTKDVKMLFMAELKEDPDDDY